MESKQITYSVCKPLKGVSSNYFIVIHKEPNTLQPIAHIRLSGYGRKHKKEVEAILNDLVWMNTKLPQRM